jgi:UDP-N-acetylglucosamine transferase subunit ALG13
MIYLTTGNHAAPFDRLVRSTDACAATIAEPFIAQIGNATGEPSHMTWHRFVDHEQARCYIAEARCVISHAGIGTIITAKEFGTPLILVPRLREYGEHNNSHQREIVRKLREEQRAGMICLDNPEEIGEALDSLLSRDVGKQPGDFGGRERIRCAIGEFLSDTAVRMGVAR